MSYDLSKNPFVKKSKTLKVGNSKFEGVSKPNEVFRAVHELVSNLERESKLLILLDEESIIDYKLTISYDNHDNNDALTPIETLGLLAEVSGDKKPLKSSVSGKNINAIDLFIFYNVVLGLEDHPEISYFLSHYSSEDFLSYTLIVPEKLKENPLISRLVDSKNIVYLETLPGNNAQVHLNSGETIEFSQNMKKIAEEVKSLEDFVQINQSTIINRNYLKEIHHEKTMKIVLDNRLSNELEWVKSVFKSTSLSSEIFAKERNVKLNLSNKYKEPFFEYLDKYAKSLSKWKVDKHKHNKEVQDDVKEETNDELNANIKKLEELKSAGILSNDEFEEKKQLLIQKKSEQDKNN